MWKTINNESELKDFMQLMCNFHDSCIKEMRYLSGAYVQENLSMYPYNNERALKVIIQRQERNPCSIEMEFTGLLKMNLFLEDSDDYTCEIIGATMIFARDRIYWCDDTDLSEADMERYKGTLICSKSVRWRETDKYIGKEEVYVSI